MKAAIEFLQESLRFTDDQIARLKSESERLNDLANKAVAEWRDQVTRRNEIIAALALLVADREETGS